MGYLLTITLIYSAWLVYYVGVITIPHGLTLSIFSLVAYILFKINERYNNNNGDNNDK